MYDRVPLLFVSKPRKPPLAFLTSMCLRLNKPPLSIDKESPSFITKIRSFYIRHPKSFEVIKLKCVN